MNTTHAIMQYSGGTVKYSPITIPEINGSKSLKNGAVWKNAGSIIVFSYANKTLIFFAKIDDSFVFSKPVKIFFFV